MLVDVTKLRRLGMRLKPAELEDPVRGRLTLKERAGATSFKRPIVEATLLGDTHSMSAAAIGLLLPLFDARVLQIEGQTITIIGTELDTRDGRVFEHVQLWRCVIAPGEAGP